MQTIEFQDNDGVHEFEQLNRELHSSLDMREMANNVVCATRAYVNCDRFAIVVYSGKKTKVLAVSGQSHIAHNSAVATSLKQLTRAACECRESLSIGMGRESRFSILLADHLKVTDAQACVVVPLFQADWKRADKPKAIGAVIAEHFQMAKNCPETLERVERISQNIAMSLENSLRYSNIFGRRVLSSIGRLLGWFEGQRLRIAAAVLLFCVIAVSVGIALTTDLRIVARGVCIPIERRSIFAPHDAQVVDVLVDAGQLVRRGDALVQLESLELESELLAAESDLSTIQERIHTISVALNSDTGIQKLSASQIELHGELKKAELELATATSRIGLLDAAVEDLKVRSPIDGEIVTFQVEELLRERPVSKGQKLLQIANPSGVWIVDVAIDEFDAGYVLDAFHKNSNRLDVVCQFYGSVNKRVPGRLTILGQRLEASESGAFLGGTIEFDDTSLIDHHIGMSTDCVIYCGQRKVAFVLFRDVVEYCYRHFWF